MQPELYKVHLNGASAFFKITSPSFIAKIAII